METVMERAAFSLAEMIEPIEPEEFFRSHWERDVLVVNRGRPDFYADLLTLDDIDRVVTTLHLDNREINLVDAKRELSAKDYCYPSGLVDPARLFALFADGATIILPQLQLRVSALAELCRAMEAQTGARFQTNIYLTPPGDAQGFRPHYDDHDVFVLQLAGRKLWKIYDTPVVLPDKQMPFDPEVYKPGEISQEFVLEAGDMAYVPRGVMHDAVSAEEMSLHVTLGALVKTWGDLLTEAVLHMARDDSAFRRALPPGFHLPGFPRETAAETFRGLMARLAAEAPFDALLDEFADDIVSSRHGLLRGQFGQIRKLDGLTATAEAAPRPNLLYRIEPADGGIRLNCLGREIDFPAHAEAPLRHALAADRFRIADLPGELDEDGKLVLVRRLVREGMASIL
jgi:ribosomal protein L16 Arg81 hydroxylase